MRKKPRRGAKDGVRIRAELRELVADVEKFVENCE